MKQLINIINQVFEMEKKLLLTPQPSIQRNLERIKNELADMGYSYHNPINEKYEYTRTDCEASITGKPSGNMVITEVIKPIIHSSNGGLKLVQKAVVIVE